jgi:hypothetical protein
MKFEGEPMTGEEVSVSSTSRDRAFVRCVRERVHFGFNATRSTPALWADARRGEDIEL